MLLLHFPPKAITRWMNAMWLFHLVHAWMYVATVCIGGFTLGVTTLYACILADPAMRLGVTQLEMGILQYFRPVIVLYGIGAIVNAVLAVRIILRRIRMSWRKKGPPRIHPTAIRVSSIVPLQPQEPRRKLQTCAKICSQSRRERWRRYGPEVTRALMLWEVANQTYQANKMS